MTKHVEETGHTIRWSKAKILEVKIYYIHEKYWKQQEDLFKSIRKNMRIC